ncbi:hypothetical protein NQ317_015310 [Molorchus minor]|uniref:C2 domain-containing protein n=1 Tax=Molorchus minor TaxID=1323400 RepID=A0ABQ9ISW6_9CUCU|nr:hypothetical protein NQ317_015310 [Molorchus minor]
MEVVESAAEDDMIYDSDEDVKFNDDMENEGYQNHSPNGSHSDSVDVIQRQSQNVADELGQDTLEEAEWNHQQFLKRQLLPPKQQQSADLVKPAQAKMPRDVVLQLVRKRELALESIGALVLLGYIICYLNWSLTIPIVTICTLVWLERRSSNRSKRIAAKAQAASMTKKEILQAVGELPAWVMFPDREKAEWVNDIILQIWPSITSFMIKWCRGPLQNKLRKNFDSFKFEDIEIGTSPPKIDGVKVYNRSVGKESIVIDFDIYYDGDCEMKFSISGTEVGTIKDFQIQVLAILFDKKSNRISKRNLSSLTRLRRDFPKTVQAAELKSLEPEGVLRVHVFEAKNLERKDVTGKSDPYVILNVGAQECRTHVIQERTGILNGITGVRYDVLLNGAKPRNFISVAIQAFIECR